jgi:hypothetical protein
MNVTEFGSNPAGIPPDGVGEGVGGVAVGEGDGARVGVDVISGDADGLGEPVAGEHAASTRQTAPAPQMSSRASDAVLVINATNGATCQPVTTQPGNAVSRSALNRSRSRHRPRMASDRGHLPVENERWS